MPCEAFAGARLRSNCRGSISALPGGPPSPNTNNTNKKEKQSPSQPKTEICPHGEAQCQAPAPKITMPAGGAVPEWGHRPRRHHQQAAHLPQCLNPPPSPQIQRVDNHPRAEDSLLERRTCLHPRSAHRHTHSASTAQPTTRRTRVPSFRRHGSRCRRWRGSERLGGPKIALRGGGGGWHGLPAKEGGGSRNGLPCRALCFVEGRMSPPKASEHKFWPGNFFSRKHFPPTYV